VGPLLISPVSLNLLLLTETKTSVVRVKKFNISFYSGMCSLELRRPSRTLEVQEEIYSISLSTYQKIVFFSPILFSFLFIKLGLDPVAKESLDPNTDLL
jgi:hypothetical protein